VSGEVRIRVQRMTHARDLPLPAYATEGAAGLDLRAAVDEPLELAPGRRALVPTGIRVAIPPGYEGQVRPRSGLAWRSGVGLPNAPGTIDSDYRGEVKVILINWSDEPLTLSRGDRVAQLVIGPVLRAVLEPVEDLDATARESGGFGHTGTR
jgi:dUTP pyrophosphatase